MSTWADAGTWTGGGLRREAFFFRSGATELYGSLYVAARVSRTAGVVCCNSWGVEADRLEPAQRAVALSMARLGGAGLVFHYPGYGDSFGELADLDLSDLSRVAADAVGEAARRCPGLEWSLAGFGVGASVACLAQRRTSVETLLLVQPALRPGSYFQRLARRRRPLAPGPAPREMMQAGTAEGMSYGYPIPQRILAHAEEADAAVGEAAGSPIGSGALIRHERPERAEVAPGRFEEIEVPGTWRFGSLDNRGLAEAAATWLDRATAERQR